MAYRDLADHSIAPKKEREPVGRVNILILRWLFFLPIFLFFFNGKNEIKEVYSFLQTLTIGILYNIMVSFFMIKRNRKYKKLPPAILYIDVFLLSVFSFLSGGLQSDIYIMFFFIMAYFSKITNSSNVIRFSIYCAMVYSVSCTFEAGNVSLDVFRLVIKGFFMIMAGFGFLMMNHEVKKYDEMHKKEYKLARTDRLTGLANRHYFDAKLHEEVAYASATGNPINILMFDLDNFKQFNDTYGHPCGDKLLTLFADIMKQSIRNIDIPVRYGGEEFLIVIRDLDMDTARSVGERIRKQLEKQRIYVGNPVNKKIVTVSCGLAQYPAHSINIKEVIDLADKALYQAKANGKNNIVIYHEMNLEQHKLEQR